MEWVCSSTYSGTQHCMEVSDKLDIPALLPPKKVPIFKRLSGSIVGLCGEEKDSGPSSGQKGSGVI